MPRSPASRSVDGADCGGARAVRRAGRACWLPCRSASVRFVGVHPEMPITCASMAITSHQGSHSRRRTRHPIPSRDQGDAEGDAPGRRQAGHPVRRRGGRRRRPARRADDHRPQQERAREPLRPRHRARGDARRRRATLDRLEKVKYSTDLADMHYVRQGDPKGLGHAVLRAKMHVGREPFAVLLGDDIIDARDPLLTRMLEVQADAQRHGRRPARGRPRPDPPLRRRRGRAHRRGRRRAHHRPRREARPRARAVEPTPSSAATCCAPRSSTCSRSTEPGKGGEIQLTDALQALAAAPDWTGGVYGVVFRGRRYDTGDRLDYIKAIVQLAVDRDDLGPELRPLASQVDDFAGRRHRRGDDTVRGDVRTPVADDRNGEVVSGDRRSDPREGRWAPADPPA